MSVYYEIPVSIKVEPEPEYMLLCVICNKVFANELALNNHTRLQHASAFPDDTQTVTQTDQAQEFQAIEEPINSLRTIEVAIDTKTSEKDVQKPPRKKKIPKPRGRKAALAASKKMEAIISLQKTAKLLAAMKPQNLFSLASQDVKYIIMEPKQEDIPSDSEMTDQTEQRQETEYTSSVKIPPTPKDKIVRTQTTERKTSNAKKYVPKKKGGLQSITGPFECLEESDECADGRCHMIFFKCCDYSIHFRAAHPQRQMGARCQVCETLLPGSGEESDSPYPCKACGAGFTSAKLLRQHVIAVHEKLKPFECEVCNKRFTQRFGLQQHMGVHTGVRPYPCPHCPKRFTQKSGYYHHMRTHTKRKPYRCVICSKTFGQPIQVKQHMRTHTQIQPFKCQFCIRGFKQRAKLIIHLKSHDVRQMSAEDKIRYLDIMKDIQEDIETNVIYLEEKDTLGYEVMGEESDESVITEEIEIEETAAMMEGEYITVEYIPPDTED